MGSAVDWKEIKYKETFESEFRGLSRRKASDPALKVEDIEGILKNMYILYGADQDKGEVQEILLSATIAAYESFISAWKAENLN